MWYVNVVSRRTAVQVEDKDESESGREEGRKESG